MNKCAYCGGKVPIDYRRSLRLRLGTPIKAKPGAKTFYHYACACWERMKREKIKNH